MDDVERAALDQGVTVCRGQGYTLRVSAVPAVHLGLLARCQPPDGGHGVPAVPAQRKARREHENRVSRSHQPDHDHWLGVNRCTDVPRGRDRQLMM
ncbi:hypothetical protein [Streptomyces sp.]|uniref:hypothetical protein n=1 Tax=Streptomyces sp. TaxID=1931 RepID=UPI0025CF1B7F|nr:hypothetical protein [Streptomyces sp.]